MTDLINTLTQSTNIKMQIIKNAINNRINVIKNLNANSFENSAAILN